MSIPVLNFRIELAKELYDLMFLIAIYSPNNDNKHPSEMRGISFSQQSLYCNRRFSRLGTHFDDRPKILTCRQTSRSILLLTNGPIKKDNQSNRPAHYRYE